MLAFFIMVLGVIIGVFLLGCFLITIAIYLILYAPKRALRSQIPKKADTNEPVKEILAEDVIEEVLPDVKSEGNVSSDNQTVERFVPITVADDEYYAPPMAKSSILLEEDPADDDDVIKDSGEASYYEELAIMQEQLENA